MQPAEPTSVDIGEFTLLGPREPLHDLRGDIEKLKLLGSQMTEVLVNVDENLARLEEQHVKELTDLEEYVNDLTAIIGALQGDHADAGPDVVFVFGKAGRKYHKSESCANCKSAKSLPIALSKQVAVDLHYEACKTCAP